MKKCNSKAKKMKAFCKNERVYKDNARPVVFQDKRKSKKTKQKEMQKAINEFLNYKN